VEYLKKRDFVNACQATEAHLRIGIGLCINLACYRLYGSGRPCYYPHFRKFFNTTL